MVSATDDDFSDKAAAGADKALGPRRRRFRLLAALAAPFRDIDERAVRRPSAAAVRNNSKGNMFVPSLPATAKVAVKRFPRGGD